MIVLRVCPEYGCWPTWEVPDDDVPDNVSPRDLPIPDDLATELLDWDDRYQATLDQEYPPWSGFRDVDEATSWLTHGRSLIARLAAALGTESYRVVNRIESSDPTALVAVRDETGVENC